MTKISAVLISLNEEAKIGRALESLRDVADEIVVVDSGSNDRTEEICRRFTDRFLQRTWPGYRLQKQFATDQAEHDWVLSLDCDEELSDDLRRELLEWKAAPRSSDVGYRLPRMTRFMGRWLRHAWHPDRQLRLYRRDSGSWQGGNVHESFRIEASPVGEFRHPILHYTYSDFSEYLQQLDRFSTLSAADYLDRGKSAGPWSIALGPPAAFIKSYLLKRGFLDGLAGFVACAFTATSTLFKLLKLWELERRQAADSGESHREGLSR